MNFNTPLPTTMRHVLYRAFHSEVYLCAQRVDGAGDRSNQSADSDYTTGAAVTSPFSFSPSTLQAPAKYPPKRHTIRCVSSRDRICKQPMQRLR